MTSAVFEDRWRDALEARARVIFIEQKLEQWDGNYWVLADEFVAEHGLNPIGFNWELLDPDACDEEPRSARAILVRATKADMEFPQQQWLGVQGANRLADEFLALFEPPVTVLTNRLEDYWNPLSEARIEWAFVGFDAARVALLLLMRD